MFREYFNGLVDARMDELSLMQRQLRRAKKNTNR